MALTRRPVQAGALEAGLEGRQVGTLRVTVKHLPLTDFALPSDPRPLQDLVARVHAGTGEDLLILTSPNAVRALLRCGWDPRRGAARLAATGPGTVDVVRAAGAT
ncbi:MAG: uroporphyrinogen-III synthase, partial [Micrococcus sp.]|nr:uroporphyrinogen-III synthase [Micrococcus sp.]